MKWRKTLPIIALCLIAHPVGASKPLPPVEHLFPVLLGMHNPGPHHGYNEFGFSISIDKYHQSHYEDGSLCGYIVLKEHMGTGFEDNLCLLVKVENLIAGTIGYFTWEQTTYERERDRHLGDYDYEYAKLYSPRLAGLKHARITLLPTCGMPIIQYCQW